ncbi:MAG: metallophosphoesterase [Sphingomonadales bacterium]|nr:MAG: metallophosphoesterase [Sphingomonadales bacterium]
MSRIAVLSDIHGNLPALKAVLRDAEGQGCTQFWNLGDILSGPLWPAETADFLMALDWPTIAGNHERQVLTLPAGKTGESDAFTRTRLSARHLEWMASLPAARTLDGVHLCHGTPRSDVEHFLETVEPQGLRRASEAEVAERLGDVSERLTLCGHSHVAGQMQLGDGRVVANPGSVGLQGFDDDHPFPYRVENGDPAARYLVIDDGMMTMRATAYDHEAAAAKAASEGFHAWAMGLRTGRMTV